VGGSIRGISKERREIMKTRKYFILVVVAFVLVVGLLAYANSERQSQISDDIQSLEKSIADARNQEVYSDRKIADRDSFLEGVFFAQKVMGNIRKEGSLLGLRIMHDPKIFLDLLCGVVVVVEDLPPEAEKYGLTKQLLQTDAELHLRSYGMRVGTGMSPHVEKRVKQIKQDVIDNIDQLWQQAYNAKSDEDFLQATSNGIRLSELLDTTINLSSQVPTLYINVNTSVLEDSSLVSFTIIVELRDLSYLCRNGAMIEAVVWQKGLTGSCSLGLFKEHIRESLKDFLDEFINDCLAANPKDRSSEDAQ
jgi:hypothetical protein